MKTHDMFKPLLFVLVLGLGACSTTQHQPNAPQQSASGVRVLNEYPDELRYRGLGKVKVSHYQFGFRTPTVLDVMPKLKAKAAAAGGNAIVIRSQQVGRSDRTIVVTAEILAVELPEQD